MKIYNIDLIHDFSKKHPQSRKALFVWVNIAQLSNWKTPSNIKLQFRSADFLSGNRVVFNISGNKYRLSVQVAYQDGMLAILSVNTHAEYSKKPIPPPLGWP